MFVFTLKMKTTASNCRQILKQPKQAENIKQTKQITKENKQKEAKEKKITKQDKNNWQICEFVLVWVEHTKKNTNVCE